MGSDSGAAPRGKPLGTAEEQRSIEDVTARGWGEIPPRLAADRGSDITLDCGWGRLVFGQTFDDPAVLARTMAGEEIGRRDICLYATDPHVVIGLAPQELFLDPSHTFRLLLHNYQPRHSPTRSVRIRGVREAGDAAAINRIYLACGMVPAPPETIWVNQRTPTFTYLVAENTETGEVVGTVTGVDHVAAFDDPEGGTSLWCLAVDPHCSLPAVGENLVRTLLDRFQAMGRNFLDLSVMYDNSPAILLYEKLGFRRVPVYSIKRKNPVNEPLFVPSNVDRLDDLNSYARILADEALRRGIEVEVVDPAVGEMRFTMGSRSIVSWESLSELTSAVAMSRCDDKVVTRRVFTDAGLAVPRGCLAGDEATNQTFLDAVGEVVVKPAHGEQGKGITVGITDPAELDHALHRALEHCPRVLLEERVHGEDLRVVVIDGEVVAAAVRRPAAVAGTGHHTIAELIDRQSRRRSAATDGESTIPLDSTMLGCIADAGYDIGDILPAGETLTVQRTANLHTGGTIHDVTTTLHPDLARVACAAAEAIGIPVTGIDMIVADPARDDYVLIEANERPGLANHEPHPTAERFMDLLFPATSALPRYADQNTATAYTSTGPTSTDDGRLHDPAARHMTAEGRPEMEDQ